jgi:hypothetical protein
MQKQLVKVFLKKLLKIKQNLKQQSKNYKLQQQQMLEFKKKFQLSIQKWMLSKDN